MRGVFSSLFRSLVMAAFGSRRSYFRPEQAEFPAVHQSFDFVNRPLGGRCPAGCASIDALRSTNNSVIIEHQHEISSIGETFPPFAGRKFPPKGRASAASSEHASKCPQENLLAAVRGLLQRQWHGQQAGKCQQSKWFIAAVPTATTTTGVEVPA